MKSYPASGRRLSSKADPRHKQARQSRPLVWAIIIGVLTAGVLGAAIYFASTMRPR